MRLTHWWDITPHDTETLRQWRNEMFENHGARRPSPLADPASSGPVSATLVLASRCTRA